MWRARDGAGVTGGVAMTVPSGGAGVDRLGRGARALGMDSSDARLPRGRFPAVGVGGDQHPGEQRSHERQPAGDTEPLDSAYTYVWSITVWMCAGSPAALAPEPSALASFVRAAAVACGSSVVSWLRPSVAMIAPSTATPKVLPTMRVIDRMPEATPALVRFDRVHRGGAHRRHHEADAEPIRMKLTLR